MSSIHIQRPLTFLSIQKSLLQLLLYEKDQDTLQTQIKLSQRRTKSSQIRNKSRMSRTSQVKSRTCQVFTFKDQNFLSIPKSPIYSYFCMNKSIQLKNMSSIHIKNQIFLPIPNVLIMAILIQNKIKTHNRDEGKHIKLSKKQVKSSL